MAEHSIILRKTEEARLDQLYHTKCDEVIPNIYLLSIGWHDEYYSVLFACYRKKYDLK